MNFKLGGTLTSSQVEANRNSRYVPGYVVLSLNIYSSLRAIADGNTFGEKSCLMMLNRLVLGSIKSSLGPTFFLRPPFVKKFMKVTTI